MIGVVIQYVSNALKISWSKKDLWKNLCCRLHSLRLMILERLLQYLPEMRNVGGVRVIPYMQVRYLTAGKFSQEMCKCTVIA